MTQHTGGAFCFAKRILIHYRNGSFLTFVGLDESNHPVPVPHIIPETEEEHKLYETASHRAELRKIRREESKKFADYLLTRYPWE